MGIKLFTALLCGWAICSTAARASTKADSLKAMGWNVIQANPVISKTFASDVEDRRKTDLDQVLSDMISLFGGGHPCTIFVTGASQAAYQPLLDTAAGILGHTPQLGSYLSSVGTDATDSRSPAFLIFVEKESMSGHEHQLAVFAHEYYHVYQNAQLLDQPASAEPYPCPTKHKAGDVFIADRCKYLVVRFVGGRVETVDAPGPDDDKDRETAADAARVEIVFDPRVHDGIKVQYYSVRLC